MQIFSPWAQNSFLATPEILTQSQTLNPHFLQTHLHFPTQQLSPEVQFQPWCQLLLQV